MQIPAIRLSKMELASAENYANSEFEHHKENDAEPRFQKRTSQTC